jgi:hypothetical protein
MPSKDATSSFGRIGFLLPLLLIFLTAEYTTYACPDHNTRVVYRTKAANTRTVSLMAPTVITYKAPASYERCGNYVSDARAARYVAVRGRAYDTGTRYVAVRRAAPRYVAVRQPAVRYVAVASAEVIPRFGRARYGAVYDVDYGLARREAREYVRAPRYVAVRSDGYDDNDVHYVAVRRIAPRVRYVAVREVDSDYDAPRYVAVRRAPVYDTTPRYVVRDDDVNFDAAPARYVALRDVEPVAPRHVVVKSDYLAGTQEVIVPDTIEDDTADAILPSETVGGMQTISYRDAALYDGNGETYIATSDFESPCARPVALRTCSEDVGMRTISYVPANSYNDEQAIFDDTGPTYAAAIDVADACLSRVSYLEAPTAVHSVPVSYVPVDDADEDAFLSGSEPAYIKTVAATSQPRWVALDEDQVFDDLDPTWVAENRLEDSCSCPLAARAFDEGIVTDMVSHGPAKYLDDVDTVNAVPVADIADVDDTNVSYVPVDELQAETVSYVPVGAANFETVSYIPVEEMNVATGSYVPSDTAESVQLVEVVDRNPRFVSLADTEPVYVVNGSTVLNDADECDLAGGLY